MDRRTFLKGGILTGAAVASSAFIGCTTNEALQAFADEAIAEPWYGSPADPASFDITETLDCELLVCGCGAGGLVATAVAAEAGANVICIEKGSNHGSMKTYFGIVGARDDEAWGVTADKMTVMNELTRYTNGFCDPRVVRTWVEESGETFDWLTDALADQGVTPFFETDTGSGFHGIWPVYPIQHGFHIEYTEEQLAAADEAAAGNPDPKARMTALPGASDYLFDKALAWGADIRFNTPLIQLLQAEDGSVTGAIAQSENGYIQINASNGVILATGGYEADGELLKELNPRSASIGGYPMYTPTNMGDGIKIGIWAGGEKDEIPTLMTFSRAAVAPEDELGFPYAGATCWMGDQPFLRVNMKGERVCCESSPYDYPLLVATSQPHNKIATIWDANYQEHIKTFHTLGCSRIDPSTTVSPDGVPTGEGLTFEANDMMIAGAMEQGIIQQADTLEELAEKLLMPAESLVATVERYNQLCEKGIDEDFGKEAKDMLPLTTPPYTGAYFGGHVLCTIDGLKIDKHGRVVNVKHEPISGLYAVGNCSGSIYAGSYPELLIGNANGRTVTYGRHAARHALGLIENDDIALTAAAQTATPSKGTEEVPAEEAASVDCSPCHGDAHNPGDENPHGY